MKKSAAFKKHFVQKYLENACAAPDSTLPKSLQVIRNLLLSFEILGSGDIRSLCKKAGSMGSMK